ncbi:MAG: hypothetical protein LBT12_06400 [Oscillospiraceae bacterium]|jgi:hypothetical protein|nr:hypothetical protein [Oscillospiraceae bacterium]
MKTFLEKSIDLGHVVVTAHANNELATDDVICALTRHASCDWGDVCDEDWERNNRAAQRKDARIFSAYHDEFDTKFWIITEWNRSYTTVLFPEDY